MVSLLVKLQGQEAKSLRIRRMVGDLELNLGVAITPEQMRSSPGFLFRRAYRVGR